MLHIWTDARGGTRILATDNITISFYRVGKALNTDEVHYLNVSLLLSGQKHDNIADYRTKLLLEMLTQFQHIEYIMMWVLEGRHYKSSLSSFSILIMLKVYLILLISTFVNFMRR